MDRYLIRDKLAQIFTEALGSSISGALNILLFLSLLVSVLTPYTYIGLAFFAIIGGIEIWFALNVFLILRSANIRYKITEATLEWTIIDSNTGSIRAKKRYLIHLTQSTKSICYYLEPGERIIQSSGVLPIYSNKKCEDTNYGYIPVELYFESYYPQGTDVQLEIVTETKKESPLTTGVLAFHTHNRPQRLSLFINIAKNGRDHQLKTTLECIKGQHQQFVSEQTINFRQREPNHKLIWESDKVINNAVYKIKWDYD